MAIVSKKIKENWKNKKKNNFLEFIMFLFLKGFSINKYEITDNLSQ